MTLWELYQNTVFLMPQPLSKRLDFAVITAHNPEGKVLTEAANQKRDLLLQSELITKGYKNQPLWGCSADLKHKERSWAVVMDKPSATTLGIRLKQNAIFWVSHDELYLLPCLMQENACHLGRFSERIIESPDAVDGCI